MKFATWVETMERQKRQDYFTYLNDAHAKIRSVLEKEGRGDLMPPWGWGEIQLSHEELVKLLIQHNLASETAAPRFAAAMKMAAVQGLQYDSPTFDLTNTDYDGSTLPQTTT